MDAHPALTGLVPVLLSMNETPLNSQHQPGGPLSATSSGADEERVASLITQSQFDWVAYVTDY